MSLWARITARCVPGKLPKCSPLSTMRFWLWLMPVRFAISLLILSMLLLCCLLPFDF